jgi:hypothetical protein
VMRKFQKYESVVADGRTRVFEDQPVRAYTVHSEAVEHHLPMCLYKPTHEAYSDVKALTQVLLQAMER